RPRPVSGEVRNRRRAGHRRAPPKAALQRPMEFFVIQTLIGLSYGLLLFMLSSGLTLIFSMMGVLNFAHASFYMLGAYFAYQVMRWIGYWPALLVAPLLVGVI